MDLQDDALADSVGGAAARLGISRTLAYAEIKAGRLRALKVGRRTIVAREDQVAWLRQVAALRPSEAA